MNQLTEHDWQLLEQDLNYFLGLANQPLSEEWIQHDYDQCPQDGQQIAVVPASSSPACTITYHNATASKLLNSADQKLGRIPMNRTGPNSRVQ